MMRRGREGTVARAVGVTPDLLTAAAADLADEVGFERVTVSALARRLGVRDASLYSHVTGLHDLRARVAALALHELADQVASALAGRAGKDALVAFARAYRDYARSRPGRYAASRLELADPPAAVVTAARRHAELTRALLRGYRLVEPDQTDAVRFLHATVHGFTSMEAAGGFRHHPRPVDASWDRALDVIDAVLRRWPD